MRPYLTRAQKLERNQLIAARYQNGATIPTLAAEFTLTEQAIRQVLGKLDIPLRKDRRSMPLMDPRDRQIRDAKIAIDAEQGLTLQQLSVKWQLTQQRISQILNRQAAA